MKKPRPILYRRLRIRGYLYQSRGMYQADHIDLCILRNRARHHDPAMPGYELNMYLAARRKSTSMAHVKERDFRLKISRGWTFERARTFH